MIRVVLASQSPRRRELLAELVCEFEIVVAGVAEPTTDDPIADARALAAAKAMAVAPVRSDAVVIGADTIVFDRDRSYGKPIDEADAAAMLTRLQGRPHQVVTAVSAASPAGVETAHSISTVHLRAFTPDEIARSVASSVPLDKAGGYAIQDGELHPVERLSGCYCGVMGLPLWLTHRLLVRVGADVREPVLERCLACPERPTGAR